MSSHMKFAIGGIILGIILLIIGVPGWAIGLVFAAAIAVPAVAWLMLDPSQRRRIRGMRRRGQIGR